MNLPTEGIVAATIAEMRTRPIPTCMLVVAFVFTVFGGPYFYKRLTTIEGVVVDVNTTLGKLSLQANTVEKRLGEFMIASQISGMDHELHLLDKSIYEVQTKIGAEMKSGHDPDAIDSQRLVELKSDRDTKERQINQLMREHPNSILGSDG